MKLTNGIRAQFVHAVLADIKTKLDEDEIRKFVLEEAMAALPPSVRKLYDDLALRPYVQHKSVGFDSRRRATQADLPWDARTLYVPSVLVPAPNDYKPSEKTKKRVERMLRELEEKLDAKDSLKARLTQMASSCKTTEALAELLPHLAGYIPKPLPKEMAHPVPAVLVKDMMAELRKLGVTAKREEAVAA